MSWKSLLSFLFPMVLSRWKAKQQRRLAIAAIAQRIYMVQRRRRQSQLPSRLHFMSKRKRKRKRERRSVQSVYEHLGPYYFKRAFRMSYLSFSRLASKLCPYMVNHNLQQAHCNGPIHSTVCLAWALRYSAGGASYDIATSFGIAPSEVLESVQDIVDVVNNYKEFNIEFPESHDKLTEIN